MTAAGRKAYNKKQEVILKHHNQEEAQDVLLIAQDQEVK